MDKRRKMMIEALRDAVEGAKRNDHVVRMSTEVAGQLIEMLLDGDEWRSIADDPPPEPNEHWVLDKFDEDRTLRYTTSDPILVLTEKGVYRAEACDGRIDIDTLARDPGQPTHWMPMPGAAGASGSGYADRVAAPGPPLREDGRRGMADREQVIISLAEGIRFVESRGYGGIAHVMNEALELLKEQPEIVRCSECCRRASYSCPIYHGGDGMHDEPDDWFCGDGERGG